jgi:hypothetical protein
MGSSQKTSPVNGSKSDPKHIQYLFESVSETLSGCQIARLSFRVLIEFLRNIKVKVQFANIAA